MLTYEQFLGPVLELMSTDNHSYLSVESKSKTDGGEQVPVLL